MASATTISLSWKDSAVLSTLFDPDASIRSCVSIDAALPESYDPATLSDIKDRERAALQLVNKQEPTIWMIQSAIDEFSSLITAYPKYASAWNNRAQATRLLFNLSQCQSHPAKIKRTYNDLSKAIELASPAGRVDAVTPSAAQVLASAHTHRGYILWRASRPDAAEGMLVAIESLRGLGKEELEELASKDFAIGGRYGNTTAQQLAVMTNPYSKLCGNIVREALQKEISDFQRSTDTNCYKE